MHWIREKAAASLNPSQVETYLIQLSERLAGKRAAACPMSSNNFRWAKRPCFIFWQSPVSARRDLRRILKPCCGCASLKSASRLAGTRKCWADLQRSAGNSIADQDFAALRFWKGREMTRIARSRTCKRSVAGRNHRRAFAGRGDLHSSMCSNIGTPNCGNAMVRPTAEFAILALGKLGGGELNHSSDVDLLFLYSEEGQLTPHISYHEFFNRLGKRILETFSTPHPAGSLFRVDLRLRPEGSAGPLARSLESMENYYAGFGETWERLALIKARGIGGSRELAYEFLRQHQPFIYPEKRVARFAG